MQASTKKILIIEDDRNYLFILKTSLAKENLIVLTAEKGKEGIELALKEKPDLVIIDLLLPDIHGIDIAEKLREAGVRVPLLFLTNVGDSAEISRALEVTVADYLIKSDTRIDDVVKRIKSKLGLIEN